MPYQGKTVLLADDNPGIVDLLTMILKDEGIHVETAANGEEVLDRVRSVQPDLIILDIMMPVMDGWETAARLLADSSTASIPIIFLTARAKTNEQLRGWSLPIFEFITKPFAFDDVLEKVRAVLSTEPEELPELRERLRREKLRALLGMGDKQ